MKKINLGKISEYKTKNEVRGSLPKFWIELNGEKYLFKSNFITLSKELRTDFGEVLYSNICKKLKVPCVDCCFASFIDERKQINNGVLVKNFLKENEFSINYSEIISDNAKIDKIKSYYSVENLDKSLQRYVLMQNFKINKKRINNQLVKQCILDYFLAQDDRGLLNIEFIANSTELKLAPIFDNGFCLAFGEMENKCNYIFKSLKANPNYINDKDGVRFSVFASDNTYSPTDIREIYKLSQKSRDIRKFVNELLKIDIIKELQLLEIASESKLSPAMFNTSVLLFNRKRDLYKNYVQNNDFEKNI